MPFEETKARHHKIRFMGDWLSGEYTKRLLCEFYQISGPTGDKWIERYRQEGAKGLHERSCEPHHHANARPEAHRGAYRADEAVSPTLGTEEGHRPIAHVRTGSLLAG